jgi:hypothetical protein
MRLCSFFDAVLQYHFRYSAASVYTVFCLCHIFQPDTIDAKKRQSLPCPGEVTRLQSSLFDFLMIKTTAQEISEQHSFHSLKSEI